MKRPKDSSPSCGSRRGLAEVAGSYSTDVRGNFSHILMHEYGYHGSNAVTLRFMLSPLQLMHFHLCISLVLVTFHGDMMSSSN